MLALRLKTTWPSNYKLPDWRTGLRHDPEMFAPPGRGCLIDSFGMHWRLVPVWMMRIRVPAV